MKRILQYLLFLMLFGTQAFAQNVIPNAGFVNWVNDTQPERWSTGNNLGGFQADAITQTNNSFSGQFAVRGEILESPITPGTPWLPSLWLGSQANTPPPISENYTHLRGKYLIQNINEFNTTFQVQINLLDENMLITAVGQGNFTNDSGSFIDFEVELDYDSPGNTNDAALLQIIISLGMDGDDPSFGIGSYFILDDLELVNAATSIEYPKTAPTDFQLKQNYPNPFNPSTNIEFSTSEDSFVQLKVYNILGVEVATLINENLPAGNYQTNWNARNMASGMYIYKLRSKNTVLSKKMTLLQ